MHLSRSLRIVGFLVLQGVATLLLAEAALRLLRPHHSGLRTLLYQASARTHYQDARTLEALMARSVIGHAPFEPSYGFVRNDRGLRTRVYQDDKPAGALRVVVIGDSFTYASGALPHALHWPTRLEDALRRGMTQPVEVLRLGVPATGPQFQLRLWQLEGVRLEPDVVVLAFFVGNDFMDEQGAGQVERGRGRWVDHLAERVVVVRAARNLRRLLRARAASGASDSAPSAVPTPQQAGRPIAGYEASFDHDRPTFSEEAFHTIQGRRMALVARADRAAFDGHFARVAPTLDAFADEVTAVGARLVVMVIPDEYQVHDDSRAATMARAGTRAEDFDLTLPQRALGAYLSERDIEYLDLLPAFRTAAEAGERLYKNRDTHWNPAGNALAASLLADCLLGNEQR